MICIGVYLASTRNEICQAERGCFLFLCRVVVMGFIVRWMDLVN